MIVISPSLALSLQADPAADNPVFCWKNLLGPSDILAGSTVAGYPASNLATIATHEIWQSDSSSAQYLTFTVDEPELVDSICFARHNFGTGLVEISAQLLTSTGPDVWTEIVPPFYHPDDSAIIMLFPAASVPNQKLRVRLAPLGSVKPRAAVAFVGKALVMERSFPSEITPLTHSARPNVSVGVAEAGELLGAIILSETLGAPLTFQMLNDAWYRVQMAPFVKAANRFSPFFVAAQPGSQPAECAYAWFSEPALPVFKPEFESVDLSLNLRAVP